MHCTVQCFKNSNVLTFLHNFLHFTALLRANLNNLRTELKVLQQGTGSAADVAGEDAVESVAGQCAVEVAGQDAWDNLSLPVQI